MGKGLLPCEATPEQYLIPLGCPQGGAYKQDIVHLCPSFPVSVFVDAPAFSHRVL